jgi:predicted nucleotidyltransferase component of viral defense system
MITKQDLQFANRKGKKYPLDIAEKDYCLAEAIKLISQSPLGEKIVFKGGTAIHHCYLSQHRFSEDLDFTSLDKNLQMEEVVQVLESTGDFVAKKQHESNATVKIERLVYRGILDQPGAIKVEIDRLQNVALPAVAKKYENSYGVEATVKTMQLDEIVSEKIRASSTRSRYRDFYDLYLLLEDERTDLERSIELARQKEIRKTVSPEEIRKHWQEALVESEKEKSAIYSTKIIQDTDISKMIAVFDFTPILPSEKDSI